MKAETKSDDLFRRYIQTKERLADLIEYDLGDLLSPGYRKQHGEPLWRHTLSYVAELLGEEEVSGLDGIAPEGCEGLVRFYDLYGGACAKAADAIYEFLDGPGEISGIESALSVLQAHNDARDTYLETIDFPAWL